MQYLDARAPGLLQERGERAALLEDCDELSQARGRLDPKAILRDEEAQIVAQLLQASTN